MRRSNWTIFRVVSGVTALVAMSVPMKPLRADTTINSGTTTVSTGTNFDGDLYVATTGTATLNLIAGGYATNTNGYLGQNAGGVGTANVSSGTWASSGNLYVGNFGTGTLNVNGGNVTNAIGYISYNNGNVGTATVSSGTWANSGGLVVGDSGFGTLNVTGGYVSNRDGTVGNSSDGVGIANVSSGTWANSRNLTVGYLGTGTLNVNGGYVSNANGSLGLNVGRVGTATVSSGTWANSGSLTVGNSGTGTLNVNGGYVSNTAGTLGSSAGSVGTATVSSGTWANSGNLTVGLSGTGTLSISGTGLVSVGGTLTRGAAGTISLNSGGTLQIGVGSTGGVLLGGTGSFVNNGTLVFNRSDASTYSGVISGTGTVTKQGGGTLTLAGANSYLGGTTISDGVLALGSANAVGTSGKISFGGGTLQYSVSNTTDYSSRFSTTASQAYEIDTNGQNVTFASPLTSSGGTLTKSGTGTLTLSGNNSYTGGSTISAGVLQVGAGGATGSIAGSVVNNATLAFNRSDASTYSGVISGAGTLTKTGAGTLTLAGDNYYTGGTTINDGVLALGSANAVGTSGTISFGGGTLQYSASNTTDYSSRFSTAASQAYEVDTNGQSVTLASPLTSSGGSLTKSGAGTLTLSGNNSYTGGTTISGGVLQVGAGGTTGSIAGDVVNNSSLVFNRSDASTFSGSTSGTGALSKSGAGTLTLSGNNSYTGGTTISGGVLQVGAGGTTGSIVGNVVNNATLAFNRSDASTHSGFISGTGNIQNAGTGTTTLTGQTSFTNGLGATAGRLIAGSTASVNGFSTTGSLAAASGATLELKSKGLAYVNGLSTLTGGTIRAANGISLGAGANVVGTGVISGFVSAAYGSRAEADGGKLTVGDASSYVGFASAGLLYTNANEVELLDRNESVLGSLTQLGDGSAVGTLRAANGMLLEQGKNLVGRGTVYGNFINQGHVYGDGSTTGQKIIFAAGSTVSGIGSFENVVFDGTYSPGNSPAITNLSNGEFSSASSLLIELGGTQPGTQYDRVVDSSSLALLGGTLNVALYNGFVPSYGNSFEILQYGQHSGDFGAVNYPALSGGLSWERTTSATAMTITVVPEPISYVPSAIATAGLASLMRWRKRRTRESTG